jgi:hypothetical protein
MPAQERLKARLGGAGLAVSLCPLSRRQFLRDRYPHVLNTPLPRREVTRPPTRRCRRPALVGLRRSEPAIHLAGAARGSPFFSEVTCPLHLTSAAVVHDERICGGKRLAGNAWPTTSSLSSTAKLWRMSPFPPATGHGRCPSRCTCSERRSARRTGRHPGPGALALTL